MSRLHALRLGAATIATAVLAACGGGGDADSDSPAAGAQPGTKGAPAASVTPTGKVITVEMFTDEKGNYFQPKDIEAQRGDLLRFTLTSGVHNVHFLPDSNPGKTGLPPVSEYLQLPGQTYDLTVSMAPGHYVFQCDPHALLGMVGKLEVEDEKN